MISITYHFTNILMSTNTENKKKPGRPKKKPEPLSININGIVNSPTNADNILEIVYCAPILFKKILLLMKQFEVSEINFEFTNTYLRILSTDRINKSIIDIVIYGDKIHFYYCKFPINVCVTRYNLEKVLSQLNKNNDKITFILRENYRSLMYIIVHDEEYANENIYEICVICQNNENIIEIPTMLVNNFMIKFKMSMQHFKSIINNARKMGNCITIQKTFKTNLQLTTMNMQTVAWYNIYTDETKLELVDNMKENDMLSISVDVEYLRPIANSNISENITISCCNNYNKMLLSMNLHQVNGSPTCTINIHTDIREFQINPT